MSNGLGFLAAGSVGCAFAGALAGACAFAGALAGACAFAGALAGACALAGVLADCRGGGTCCPFWVVVVSGFSPRGVVMTASL